MLIQGMSYGVIGPDLIAIAAAVFGDRNIAASRQIVDDALYGAFGDADIGRNFAHADIGPLRNQNKHVRVVGKKRDPVRNSTRVLSDHAHLSLRGGTRQS